MVILLSQLYKYGVSVLALVAFLSFPFASLESCFIDYHSELSDCTYHGCIFFFLSEPAGPYSSRKREKYIDAGPHFVSSFSIDQ
jgi:hypothetical protein